VPIQRVICIIGPECTGKTTLAQRLAGYFKGTCVAEFAREYAEARNNQLSAHDVEPIARGEISNLESRISNLVFRDTDLISTVVYSRSYYGKCPEWIVDEARKRRADLYLLMDTDVPWFPDAARDSPGDAREDLFDAFRAALDEFETRWVIISGDWEERFRTAVSLIESEN
jgi:HTH-type transcriptional regulator, transcriptional repressor of NAD biosynthesis genes